MGASANLDQRWWSTGLGDDREEQCEGEGEGGYNYVPEYADNGFDQLRMVGVRGEIIPLD